MAFFFAVAGWIGLSTLISYVVNEGLIPFQVRLLWMAAGCALTFLAGLYDDYQPTRTRGILAQVRALLRGRLTSGLVKMLGILVAAALVVWKLDGDGWRLVLGIPVIAGAANLWNLLDVKPGRAIKYFLPSVAGLLIAASGGAYGVLAATAFGAATGALFFDLRERAMLGDAGANVLGFIVGIGLFQVLTTVGLALALAVILVLHVLSETVTLSRIIQAVPPLHWFDRLGRLPPHQANRDEEPEARGSAAL
jgi:UDP-N-acetylmuramyl pentapeptide phosphotransferase/UDP-N-acetylglucosamine-1-phosphate transferase